MQQVHRFCHGETRLLINNYSFVWEPVLVLAEKFGLKMPNPMQRWLSPGDLHNLLTLTDFQWEKTECTVSVQLHGGAAAACSGGKISVSYCRNPVPQRAWQYR